MWIFKRLRRKNEERIEERILLETRIEELENILCPAEAHEWQCVSESYHIVDGYGTGVLDRRYVCKRCLRAKVETEWM